MLFEIEVSPDNLERQLTEDVKTLSDSIVRELVELAPTEMQNLFSDSPPSNVGSPPANRTGNLSKSIEPFGDDSIKMLDYGV